MEGGELGCAAGSAVECLGGRRGGGRSGGGNRGRAEGVGWDGMGGKVTGGVWKKGRERG